MNDLHFTNPPPQRGATSFSAEQAVPVLVVGSLIAMFCTAVAFFTAMDTLFWTAGLIAGGCGAASAVILHRAGYRPYVRDGAA